MNTIKSYVLYLIGFISMIISFIMIPVVFIIAFFSRFIKREYDIGLGPIPMIINVYLKKSLESQGYSAQTYTISPFRMISDFDCIMQNWFYKLSPFCRLFPIIFKYKCLYIYFNGGILEEVKVYRYLEAYIYKAAGIKVVVMPFGGDCQIAERIPNIHLKNALFQYYSHYYKLNHDKIVWQVGYWCKYADAVIAGGDCIDYLSYWDSATTSYLSIDLKKLKPSAEFKFHDGDKIIIVHAPNHRVIKGSSYIEQAISRLQGEGYTIQYLCLEKKTNAEVLEIIQNADIVVDQIIGGWHGMFALEAMAFGKPVITHTRADLLNAFEEMGCLEKNELPLIDATPTTIYDVLKDLLDHPESWETIGKRSRDYVEKHHSIEVIGRYFDKINRSIGITPTNLDGGILE